jgi:rubrerythrin
MSDGKRAGKMSDLIKRSDAIKAFKDVLDCDFYSISEETPRERIEAIPSADRPQGEWIMNNLDGTFKVWDCSECGIHMEGRWSYCPHCGARMKGADDE